MTNDLEKISGIGATAAASLSKAGFTTVEALAEATPETLSVVHGFGPDRAARVIKAAQELLKADVADGARENKSKSEQSEPAIDPVIASKANSKYAFMRNPLVMIPAAAAIIIAGIIVLKPDVMDGINAGAIVANKTMATKPGTVSDAEKEKFNVVQIETNLPVDQTMDVAATAKQAQSPLASDPYKAHQDWVAKQRAEAEKFRAESEKIFAEQRAAAEKRRSDILRQLASGQPVQPPALPEWVVKQRAEAEKYRVEAEKRFTQQRAEAQKRFDQAARQQAIFAANRGYGAPVYRGYAVSPYGAQYNNSPNGLVPENQTSKTTF